MKPTETQIVERLKVVRSFQPGVRGNSFLMAIFQFFSFVGGLILFVVSILNFFKDSSTCNLSEGYLMMLLAVALMLIWKLTRMVRRRNAYILQVKKAMDNEFKPEDMQVNNRKEQPAKNNAENTNREESGLKQI